MSTTKGLLWVNGMEMFWFDCKGIYYWFGAWVSCVSQVLYNSRAFPGSAIGSAIVIRSDGPFAPLKVSLSDMRTYNFPFQLIQVAYWIAACSDNFCRR